MIYSYSDRVFAKFLSKVAHFGEADVCWPWLAGKSGGYGVFSCRGEIWLAHKWLWHYVHGPVAPGYELHHHCKNEACVNITQCVAPITFAEHRKMHPRRVGMTTEESANLGAYRRNLTHCKRGHEFTLENTRLYRTVIGNVGRSCKACEKLRSKGLLS